jgi:hypothetical protein
MTSESRTARALIRWGLIGGCVILLAALASMALVTWNRGRVLQARLDALWEFGGDADGVYVAYHYTPAPVDDWSALSSAEIAAANLQPLLPEFAAEEVVPPEGEEEWVDVDGEGGTIGSYRTSGCFRPAFLVIDEPPRGIEWLVPIFGEYAFAHVARISPYDEKFTDDHVSLLLAFPELRDLDVSRTAITDAGVRRLAGLTRLVVLDVSDRPLSEETLRLLASCRQLRELRIVGSGADPETVAYLKRELPACRIFK